MTATMTSSAVLATKRAMAATDRRRKWKAFALISPLAIFLLAIFIIPISMLLHRAVDNPEVIQQLPRTLTALENWRGESTPGADCYAALMEDLLQAKDRSGTGSLARRLNYEIAGYRSLIFKTIRHLPFDTDHALGSNEIKGRMLDIDKRWGEPEYWQAIANNKSSYSSYYLLASLDLKKEPDGSIARVPPATSAFLEIFRRTFAISAIVTLLTLALGFPLAYWIASLPKRKANLVMIFILIPFWTSILVRIAAWIVLLQRQGLVNKTLMGLGATDTPVELLFNRTGVYIAMTHILLPFMILPLYSVMQSVPSTYQRAAVSLGSHPFSAFWRVYVPQTYPGIGAGTLLVFIIAVGYYITPALLGGADDQMISYYVAYFTNQTINWGMASALGFLLLVGTLLLYFLYRRLSGRELGLG
ncbi:putative spermidine/putrescine transport system permease protein [Pollutimonas bauzanensis]|uniref:Putative spermidine/putrescine transport system permease protein n=2 Tax=Pollutimonas bauzanensis TaxID=658167 RepID=A0A1M5SXQ0_9BURK|nr:ABC transporter permease [Pollutimonas bauzanensis]SHH43294.1 putative spermidine/putrescine transport system permease protein [Pollutimonas bauzanensis]